MINDLLWFACHVTEHVGYVLVFIGALWAFLRPAPNRSQELGSGGAHELEN